MIQKSHFETGKEQVYWLTFLYEEKTADRIINFVNTNNEVY